MRRDPHDADEGFTLIELVITVVILSVVLGALTMGVVALLRTTGVTTDRLISSHDAQLLTDWITTDVQSAASAPDLATGTTPGCADDGSLPVGGVNVAQMTWTDRSAAPMRVYHAAYRIEQTSVGPPARYQLVRYFCEQGQASTHFPVVRALKDGTICPTTPPGSAGVCVMPASWPRFELQIVSASGNQSYTFTVGATGRTAAAGTTDSTPPNFVSAAAYNTDSSGVAGAINRIVVTFDEALYPAYTAPLTRWTLNGAPNTATITSVTISNRTATLNLSASGSPINTSTAGFTIDLQSDPNGVRDGAGNRASFVGVPVSDGMAPIPLVPPGAIAVDSNADAKIDRIDITPSETIDTTDPNPATFHLASADPAWAPVFISGTDVVGNTVRLTLGNTPLGTDVPTDLTVAMDADPSAVRDASSAHNFTAWPATPVNDGVAPELLSIKSHDTNQDGKLDQILVDFSESLQPSTDTGLWHLSTPAGWLTPPRVINVLVTGSQVTLTIDPTSVLATADTAVTGMTARLDPSASTGIRDSVDNPASFSGRFVTDAMAPILTGLTFSGGATAGLLETTDQLVATFSEQLAAPATTTQTLTLDQPAGAATATIDIPGFTNGAIDTLSSGYFASDGNRAQWQASVVRSGNRITVTLTGACVGAASDPTCANLRAGTLENTPLDLSATIVDRVSVLNVVLDPTLDIRWF